MKLRRLGGCCLAIAMASTAFGAHAQWTWRDRSGQLHASDRPPPADVPDRDIVKRPTSLPRAPAPRPSLVAGDSPAGAASAAPTAAAKVDPELEARLKKAEQERLAQAEREKARVAAQRAENCQRAQENLRTLSAGTRLTRINERGEREFLDDGARNEQLARTQQVVESECR